MALAFSSKMESFTNAIFYPNTPSCSSIKELPIIIIAEKLDNLKLILGTHMASELIIARLLTYPYHNAPWRLSRTTTDS